MRNVTTISDSSCRARINFACLTDSDATYCGLFSAAGTDVSPGGCNHGTAGVYLDDLSGEVEIIGNTIIRANRAGVFLHNNINVRVTNNSFYGCYHGITSGHDTIAPEQLLPPRGLDFSANMIVSLVADPTVQDMIELVSLDRDFDVMGSSDNNFFCHPLLSTGMTALSYSKPNSVDLCMDLPGLRSSLKREIHSTECGISVPPFVVSSVGPAVRSKTYDSNSDGSYAMGARLEWRKDGLRMDGGYIAAVSDGSQTHPDQGFLIGTYIGRVQAGVMYRIRYSSQCGSSYATAKNHFYDNTLQKTVSIVSFTQLSEDRAEVEFFWQPPSDFSDIVFLIEPLSGSLPVFIDNVMFEPVVASKTDISDRLIIVYNEQPIARAVVLPAGLVFANIRDQTQIHSGSIQLEPFRSAIL